MDEFNIIKEVQRTNCGICSFPLSVLPIVKTTALGFICGRCCEQMPEKLSELSLDKQIYCDDFPKDVSFPCSYRELGCEAILQCTMVLHHEVTCMYRIMNISCPLFQHERCSWIGLHKHLSLHLRNKHQKFFGSEISIKKNQKCLALILEIDQALAMITFDFDEKVNAYCCSVWSDMYYRECGAHKCIISFMSKNSNDSIIHQYEEKKIRYMFRMKYFSWNDGLLIPSTILDDLFGQNEEILVKFRIDMKEEVEQCIASLDNLDLCSTNDNKLKMIIMHVLKCCICANEMVPPIFTCLLGHTLCNKCRKQIEKCPKCRSEFLGGRNFSLENFSSVLFKENLNRNQ